MKKKKEVKEVKEEKKPKTTQRNLWRFKKKVAKK